MTNIKDKNSPSSAKKQNLILNIKDIKKLSNSKENYTNIVNKFRDDLNDESKIKMREIKIQMRNIRNKDQKIHTL